MPLADHRPPLAAAVQPARRGDARRRTTSAAAGVGRRAGGRATERLDAAAAPLRARLSRRRRAATAIRSALVRELEAALDAGKDAWPLAAIRTLWDVLLGGQAPRAAPARQHEARWLNLCGFLLRPGFGHALDEWRIQQLWKLYSQGLRFPRAAQCRVEWWGLWKRIAGGLQPRPAAGAATTRSRRSCCRG